MQSLSFRASVTLLSISATLFYACSDNNSIGKQHLTPDVYFQSSETGVKTGGIKEIAIETPKGKFNVWTKTIGNNPDIKLLLLNGGPGLTHEYFECFESFLPAAGIEFIYYDQLGCGNSDNPNDTALWSLPRYVEEVEQVRKALNLSKNNFYLLGHSWGAILAMDYAVKYQQHLKGLILSNMMCDAAEYDDYAANVLAKQMNPLVLDTLRTIEASNDFNNPKYMELLMPHFYAKHICRIPLAEWPEPVTRSFSKINASLYVTMQGPSEFGIAGNLETWSRKSDLKNIRVPALTIGATHDTMDPEHMKWMAAELPNGSFLFCERGSHMCFYDDQETYMRGLVRFIEAVNEGKQKVDL